MKHINLIVHKKMNINFFIIEDADTSFLLI